jgi:hypothetical protein
MSANTLHQPHQRCITGRNESVRGHHGHRSWLTPKRPKTLISAYAARSNANFRRGTLSVPHGREFVLPLEQLAADHL